MTPAEALARGAALLSRLLESHGFVFHHSGAGRGSGGDYACGEFSRDDRRLQLHVRHSLGLVRYHVGDVSLEHAEYVRAVGAIRRPQATPAYPGFSDHVLEAFQHLGSDIERFGEPFLTGSRDEFKDLVDWVSRHPRPKGLAHL